MIYLRMKFVIFKLYIHEVNMAGNGERKLMKISLNREQNIKSNSSWRSEYETFVLKLLEVTWSRL